MGWPYFFPRILALKNCVLVTLQCAASDLTASEAIARCHYHVACGFCHRLLPPASLHEWPTAQASSESAPQQRRPHTPYLAGWLTARLTRWGSKRWASVELKRDPHALVFITLLLLTKQTPSKNTHSKTIFILDVFHESNINCINVSLHWISKKQSGLCF